MRSIDKQPKNKSRDNASRWFILKDQQGNNMASSRTEKLQLAMKNESLENIISLFENEKYLNYRDEEDLSPAHYASSAGRVDVLAYLKQQSTPLQLTARRNVTPLHLAKDAATAKFLLENNENPHRNINRLDHNDYTPLAQAIIDGRAGTAKYLVEQGADPLFQRNQDSLFLAIKTACTSTSALFNSYIELIEELLLRYPKLLNAQTDGDLTPIHIALDHYVCQPIQVKLIIKLLIQKEVNLNATNKLNETASSRFRYIDPEEYQTYLKSSPDIMLHAAVRDQMESDILKCLENGANINYQNQSYHNQSALHIAAAYCDEMLLQQLIDLGAKTNIRDNKERTPLYCARTIKNAGCLLQNNADINALDNNNISPLHLTILNKNDMLAKFLLEQGANPNLKSKDNFAPLYTLECVSRTYGFNESRRELMDLLLSKGANINEKCNPFQQTALEHAIEDDIFGFGSEQPKDLSQIPPTIEYLLQHGADLDAESRWRSETKYSKVLAKGVGVFSHKESTNVPKIASDSNDSTYTQEGNRL